MKKIHILALATLMSLSLATQAEDCKQISGRAAVIDGELMIKSGEENKNNKFGTYEAIFLCADSDFYEIMLTPTMLRQAIFIGGEFKTYLPVEQTKGNK